MEPKLHFVVNMIEGIDQHLILVNEEELKNLLLHYDKDKYQLNNVYCIGPVVTDYINYCKKDENLEEGDSNVI